MLRITKTDIRHPITLGWNSALAQVREGRVYVLICCGNSDISKAIRSVTKSDVTHVGFLYRFQGELYVVEAVNTIREVPFESYRGYNGRLFIGTIPGLFGHEELISIAKSRLGEEYDWDDLVKIWLNSTWLSRLFKFRKDKDRRMYCSDHMCWTIREFLKQRGKFASQLLAPVISESHYSTPSEVAGLCQIICEVL